MSTKRRPKLLDLLVAAAWTIFILYMLWFVFRAKGHVTLSPRDVYVLWSLHKREARCDAHHYSLKLYREDIIGFRCPCGYEYESKRPILL
jgi:hypothetical protein